MAQHKHLVLILAREFASNLAGPTLGIADDQGTARVLQRGGRVCRRPAHSQRSVKCRFDKSAGKVSIRGPGTSAPGFAQTK